MTDKQIIIDGVDVSGCMYFDYDEGYNQETEEFVKGACKCITAHDSYGEFMYYGICKDRNCYYKQLKRKEQECEELTKIAIKHLAETFEMQEEIDQLKAENEELEYIIANKSCLAYRDFKCTKAYYTDKKLKQTLQEIKEIAKAITNGTHFSDDIEAHLKEMVNKILQKISEVEDEKESS